MPSPGSVLIARWFLAPATLMWCRLLLDNPGERAMRAWFRAVLQPFVRSTGTGNEIRQQATERCVAPRLTAEVPGLIQAVFDKLTVLSKDEATEPVALAPAVPIRRSVTDDYIICLEDGKRLKILKRHLMTAYDMTPEQYRAKWGLPHDFPMVAPSYSRRRQEMAKAIGLGRKPAPKPAPEPRARRTRRKVAAA